MIYSAKVKNIDGYLESRDLLTEHVDWKVFGALFFSMFATITGVGIVVPLLPVYAHDLGAKGTYVALIFGAFSLSRTFFLPYFGNLSDAKGRKPFIVIGLLAYTLIAVAFLFLESVEGLILLRFIQGIASAMVMPVVQAYVGEISPFGKEGLIMGLFNTSLYAGLSIGPLIGGVLNDHVNIDAAFACMGVLALLGFLWSLIFLPPRESEPAMSKSSSSMIQLFRSMGHTLKDRNFAGLFAFRFAHTCCIGVIWGFLPVFADVQFALSSSAIATLIMLSVLISGITQVPMGYLADRFNRRHFVNIGGLIVGAAMASYTWADGFSYLFIITIIFGIGGGCCMPALMAIGVQYGSRKKSMGSVMALLTMAHSLGMLLGSLLAGVMMDFFDLRTAFPIGASVMLAGWAAFLLLMPKTPTAQPAVVHPSPLEAET